MTDIVPTLWFDGQAEEAARFYIALIPNSRIGDISWHGEDSAKASGQRPGSALTVAFELAGRPFLALNGGPMFHFTEAISMTVTCGSQDEIDRYWTALTEGGQESRCGWLKDKYGLSWQIVPSVLASLMTGAAAGRVMGALMRMGKIDIQTLRDAAATS